MARSAAQPLRTAFRRRVATAAACGALLAAHVTGCHRAPEAAYWRDGPASPRPSPPLQMALAWEHAAAGCPEQIGTGDGGRWLVLWAAGSSQHLRTADGTAGDASTGAVQPPPARPPRWGDRSLELDGAAGAVSLPRGPRRGWTFHAAAAIATPPQLHRGRLLIQSLDNYVYCLRPDNGHEIWRKRLGARLTRPAAFWNDRALLIPQGSDEVLAIDLFDGTRSGSWRLPGDVPQRFVAGPVVAGDLLIAAHAPYGGASCRIVALRLTAGPAADRSRRGPGGGS